LAACHPFEGYQLWKLDFVGAPIFAVFVKGVRFPELGIFFLRHWSFFLISSMLNRHV